MLKHALIAVAVLTVAAPSLALAKGHKKAAEDTAQTTSGPIPYSQLAEEDAKLNGPAPKKHMAKKKASKEAAPAAADAGAPKQ